MDNSDAGKSHGKRAGSEPATHEQRGGSRGQLGRIPADPAGTLIIIGGNENKEGHRPILEELARRVGDGKLVIATLASEEPDPQWDEYRRVFNDLGVRRIEQLDARERSELLDDRRMELLNEATVLFFAGGDQLKITSKFGGTALCERMRELYERGGTIAGTSSGASAMSEVMIFGGDSDESQKVRESLKLSPGLGLIGGVLIDQHFAQRGRIGRLIAAVAQNPRVLGIGIDENTAVVFDGDHAAGVIGSGAVYVVDGRNITGTSAAGEEGEALSVFGVTLHLLTRTDRFDMVKRQPIKGRAGPRKR